MKATVRRLGALLLVSTLLLLAPVTAAWPGADGGVDNLLDQLAVWFLRGNGAGVEEGEAAPVALPGLSSVPVDDSTTASTPTSSPDPASDDGNGGNAHPNVDPDG